MPDKTKYVVGFLHNDYQVALIRKNRPDWQSGKWNGIGGHVEEYDNTTHDAMVREFKEETSVTINYWEHFLTLEGPNAIIDCWAKNDNGDWLRQVKTMTDEEVKVVDFDTLNAYQPGAGMAHFTIPNLKWIIPLMRQRGKYEHATVNFEADA